MKLAFWNDGAPEVVADARRVQLPSGDVVLNAGPDPENDLYAYVEAGPEPNAYQVAGPAAYGNDGWTITAARTVAWLSLDGVKSQRLAELAAKRFAVETGGLLFNTTPIPTDDRSKTLIMGACEKATEDAAYTKDWKIGPGAYATLDAAAIIAVADALEAHVAAAFANEQAHATALLALTNAQAVVDHDITQGWPENPQ